MSTRSAKNSWESKIPEDIFLKRIKKRATESVSQHFRLPFLYVQTTSSHFSVLYPAISPLKTLPLPTSQPSPFSPTIFPTYPHYPHIYPHPSVDSPVHNSVYIISHPTKFSLFFNQFPQYQVTNNLYLKNLSPTYPHYPHPYPPHLPTNQSPLTPYFQPISHKKPYLLSQRIML